MNSTSHNIAGFMRRFIWVALAVILIILPAPAQAADIYDIDACNVMHSYELNAGQYTQKIVNCIESTIIDSIGKILQSMSDYMRPVVGSMFVLATIIFGIRIMGGERNLKAKAVSFLLRLGLVWMFSYNLGNFTTQVYDVLHNMICVVSFNSGSCYSPWGQMDGFMGRLLGFGETISIVSGLLGIISAAVFSSTLAGVCFLFGVMAIIDILFFVLRVVFTYLSAIVVIAFLIVISPLIIPLAIFYSTEIYFKRWLDVLISAILAPVLLFAFLQMFLGVFDHVINDKILSMFSCDNASESSACDFRAYTKTNEPFISWMLPADANFSRSIEAVTRAQAPSTPIVQTFIDATARRAQNLGFSTPAVDFGPADAKIWQQLIYGLLLLWLYTTLMKSMVTNIPLVANNIAGAFSGIQMQQSSFEPMVQNTLQKVKDLFGSGGGK